MIKSDKFSIDEKKHFEDRIRIFKEVEPDATDFEFEEEEETYLQNDPEARYYTDVHSRLHALTDLLQQYIYRQFPRELQAINEEINALAPHYRNADSALNSSDLNFRSFEEQLRQAREQLRRAEAEVATAGQS